MPVANRFTKPITYQFVGIAVAVFLLLHGDPPSAPPPDPLPPAGGGSTRHQVDVSTPGADPLGPTDVGGGIEVSPDRLPEHVD